jgi:hypothetical protein
MVRAARVRPDPRTPPTNASDEAKPHHHRMAQQQGDDYRTAVTHMAEKVAMTGAETQAGDMIVALAIEAAEGMYEWGDQGLEWLEPNEQNIHIEVSARDAADNRFIPGLNVRVRVFDEAGELRAEGRLPMLWHPWLYHYGANFAVLEEGPLNVEVEIDAPGFPRHDKENGKRYIEDVFVRFDEVRIKG